MAFILARQGPHSGFSCSGTVVSPNVVLTAGHCVENDETGLFTPASDYLVVTGRNDVTDKGTGEVHAVSRIVVSPRYSPFGTLRGDAGLLILKTPTTAPPIALAGAADAALESSGSEATIAGWGLTSGEAEKAPRTLRWAKTKLQGATYCRHHVVVPPKIYSQANQLCTVEMVKEPATTCFGDSGGPLFVQAPSGEAVQVGITSLGSPTCEPGSPDVFTRIDPISRWIEEWIAAVAPGSKLPKPLSGSPQGPRLPPLPRLVAAQFAHNTLLSAFGERFRQRREPLQSCENLEASRYFCFTAWSYGPSTYFGSLQVYLVIEKGQLSWSSTYAIHRVNSRCAGRLHGSRRCPLTTRKGTGGP